jgi:hypothetical protein
MFFGGACLGLPQLLTPPLHLLLHLTSIARRLLSLSNFGSFTGFPFPFFRRGLFDFQGRQSLGSRVYARDAKLVVMGS